MNADVAKEAAFAACYALSRHVADMVRGFTLQTSYGELAITADEVRQHPELQHAVESILQFRLHQAERAAREAQS
jgi:hypothetical protein